MNPNVRELKKIGTWLASWNTGLSSRYMCGIFLGGDPKEIFHPLDPSDFDRCMEFLKCVDESKRHTLMFTLANKSKKWKAVLQNWPELIKLHKEECKGDIWTAPKLYKKMKEIGL